MAGEVRHEVEGDASMWVDTCGGFAVVAEGQHRSEVLVGCVDHGVGSFEDAFTVEFSICGDGFEDRRGFRDVDVRYGGSSDLCAGNTKEIWGWRLRRGGW